jgi:hypothetical protein
MDLDIGVVIIYIIGCHPTIMICFYLIDLNINFFFFFFFYLFFSDPINSARFYILSYWFSHGFIYENCFPYYGVWDGWKKFLGSMSKQMIPN